MNTVKFTQLLCVNNSAPGGTGGCLLVTTQGSAVRVTKIELLAGTPSSRSRIESNSALQGGAIGATSSTLSLDRAILEGNSAAQAGGSILASASSLTLHYVTVRDSRISGVVAPGLPVAVFEGGAIATTSGSLSLNSCTFERCSANPSSLLTTCQDYYDPASSSSSDFRGGVIAASETLIQSAASTYTDSEACAGAWIFASGRSGVSSRYDEVTNTRAFAGAGAVVLGSTQFTMTDGWMTNSVAFMGGGGLVLSQVLFAAISDNTFTNVMSQQDNGGVVWLALVPAESLLSGGNTFVDCSSPRGLGPILYAHTLPRDPVALPSFPLDGDFPNFVSYSDNSSKHSLFGGPFASSVAGIRVTAVVDGVETDLDWKGVEQFPGMTLPQINVYALDAYKQVSKSARCTALSLCCLGMPLRCAVPLRLHCSG